MPKARTRVSGVQSILDPPGGEGRTACPPPQWGRSPPAHPVQSQGQLCGWGLLPWWPAAGQLEVWGCRGCRGPWGRRQGLSHLHWEKPLCGRRRPEESPLPPPRVRVWVLWPQGELWGRVGPGLGPAQLWPQRAGGRGAGTTWWQVWLRWASGQVGSVGRGTAELEDRPHVPRGGRAGPQPARLSVRVHGPKYVHVQK